ncbi:hypothetical protein AAG570_007276, partial [Ranatra chinensis]
SEWGTCSQTCRQVAGRPACGCNPGYTIEADGFTCKSNDGSTPYVIFSNRHELRAIDLTNFEAKALIMSLKNTVALDFHHVPGKGDTIYWTDVIDDKIYKGTINGGTLGFIEVVIQSGLTTTEGLAVDWIGGNLYWVESYLDQIEVAKLNGSFRRTLIAGDMESPRAIALDPRYGLLFWTDWDTNSPRIESCSMSGESRKVIVRIHDLTDGDWPNGLTLDYQLKRLYWIDARSGSMHTVTYDGSDHREVMRGHETMSHPFAITLFGNHVYWTDWRTHSVIRANKWNGSDVYVLQRTLTQPFDIQILHPSRQPRGQFYIENPCGVNNGNCSHLCLLSVNHTRKCECPHFMRIGDDNTTCISNERVLLFSLLNEVRGVDLLQPYYHTIPTISLPHVSFVHIDYRAETKEIFWTDSHSSEVKKAVLTGGATQTIIDTGIERPLGFAIDWISGNMFVSSSGSSEKILVSNLKGEYIATVFASDETPDANSWSDGQRILSLAVDPFRGKLYWCHVKSGDLHVIESSRTDGSERRTLVTQKENEDLVETTSLAVDYNLNRLYWVNVRSKTIQFMELNTLTLKKLPLAENAEPRALAVYDGLVYYASGGVAGGGYGSAIYSCDKTTGANSHVVRSDTGNRTFQLWFETGVFQIRGYFRTTSDRRTVVGGAVVFFFDILFIYNQFKSEVNLPT